MKCCRCPLYHYWSNEKLMLRDAPSATAEPKHGEDTVSKAWIKENMLKYGFKAPDMTVTEFIEDAPSVMSKPKQGENIGTDYAECDQFICSECGIHLQGWVRIDEDDYDDGIVHEYEFRFCPNCGMRILQRT